MNSLAAATATSGGSSAGGEIVVGLISLVVYLIPSVVAVWRHVRNTGSIIVINLFLGWTIIGWVVALAMACRSKDGKPVAAS